MPSATPWVSWKRAVSGLAQACAAPSIECSIARPAKWAPICIIARASRSVGWSSTRSNPSERSRQAWCENVSDKGVRRVVTAVSTACEIASIPEVTITGAGAVRVRSGSRSAIRNAADGSPQAIFVCVCASEITA